MGDALDDGAAAAAYVLEPLLETVENFPQLERERWWSGFVIAAQAMVAESIGAERALMIAQACCELAAEEIDDQGSKAPNA